MKKYITTDGKTCREVNPHSYPSPPKEHIDFEATVQHYPITKEMPIGVTFKGLEVWQYCMYDEWNTADPNTCTYMKDKTDCQVRIAIEPTPIEKPLDGEEKEPDFIEWCKQERINFSNAMLHEFDWYNLTPKQRVIAENFMICFDQLFDKLNSLRK